MRGQIKYILKSVNDAVRAYESRGFFASYFSKLTRDKIVFKVAEFKNTNQNLRIPAVK